MMFGKMEEEVVGEYDWNTLYRCMDYSKSNCKLHHVRKKKAIECLLKVVLIAKS